MTKKDMTSLLNNFELTAQAQHETKVHGVVGKQARATALVSMLPSEKTRFRALAISHGMNLSSFFRLAAEEYIEKHKWE